MNLIERLTRALSPAVTIIVFATLSFAQTTNGEANKTDDTKKVEKTQTIASVTSEDPSAEKPVVKTPVSSEETKTTVSKPNSQSSGSEWEIYGSPYLYMTGLKGTVGARGRTQDVDLSFGDILSHFKVGIMGLVEAKKNRFVLLNDIMWINLEETRTNTPPAAFLSSEVKVKQFMWDPEAGYRLVDKEGGSLDVLGGMRLMSVAAALNTTSGILPGFSVDQRKTWATPVGGVRGMVNLSPKVFASAKWDIGGGWGADFTTQVYAGLGYKINNKFALVGGYRYLRMEYDDNSGFLFDTSMNGFVVGAKIRMK